MTVYKHIDFQVPAWGELQTPPISRLSYRGEVMADSPLMYLRLGESSGPTAHDETGNHDAQVDGILTWGATGPLILDSDTAVESNGTGGLRVSQTGWLPVGASERTIELWFKPNSNTLAYRGVNYGDAAVGARLLLIYTIDEVSVAVSSCRFGVTGLSLADHWHHLVLTFPHGATRCDEFLFYLDGALLTSSVLGGAGSTLINTVDSALLINQSASSAFNYGALDELAIYDHALSAERIYAHYQAATASGVS